MKRRPKRIPIQSRMGIRKILLEKLGKKIAKNEKN